jgi:P2 family phage contractile tail tube protein
MAIQINKLTNASVFVDGVGFLGQAMEVDLPEITQKMSDHVALGMIATTEMPSGVDKMEATIRWNALYPAVVEKFANPYAALSLQIRSSLEVYEAGGRVAQQPVVVFLRASSKTHQLGNYRQHENVELENQMAVYYVRVEINGVEKLELDATANIYRVNGVDIIQEYKTNIGQ